MSTNTEYHMCRSYPALLDKLYDMLDFIRDKAFEAGFKKTDASKIELACEEALVNIISYGYPEYRGYIEINCLKTESPGIKIIIKDKGIPYNPLTNAKNFDVFSSLELRSLGGYGVFLILKLMDEVSYKRENNHNILTLIKYI